MFSRKIIFDQDEKKRKFNENKFDFGSTEESYFSSSSDLGRLWLHSSSLPANGEALGTPGALLSVPREEPCSWESRNSHVQPPRSASRHTV